MNEKEYAAMNLRTIAQSVYAYASYAGWDMELSDLVADAQAAVLAVVKHIEKTEG